MDIGPTSTHVALPLLEYVQRRNPRYGVRRPFHVDWVVECTLTVCGARRADVGYSNAPDSEDEIEPAKAAYSDALKRAAVGFGVGRWLYEP
jgi:Rad52/22 family double-strand break repair protein